MGWQRLALLRPAFCCGGIAWIDLRTRLHPAGARAHTYSSQHALQNGGLLGDEADEDVAQVRMLDARADSGLVPSGEFAELSNPATNCRMRGRTADARPGS